MEKEENSLDDSQISTKNVQVNGGLQSNVGIQWEVADGKK